MSFLVVAGITVPVAPGGASKKSPERIGTTSRAFAGNLRTTVRAEKRIWQFTTKPLSLTDAATLEAAVDNGDAVSCSGDALAATISCMATVGDGPYVPTASAVKRVLMLTLVEI